MTDPTPASLRDPPDPSDPALTARYIGRAAAELRSLAMAAGLPFLGYLLEMAELDARKHPDA